MSTALRLTVREFDEMVAIGAFDKLAGRRVELLYGELREMPAQGPPHTRALTYLSRWSVENTVRGQVDVRVQMPIGIPELDSEPEPDLVWAAPLASDDHPVVADVFLLVEVGDSTIRNDLREKARLYSRAGVADYWVVDLQGRCVHIFREPGAQGFVRRETFRTEEIAPLAFPAVKLSISDLFESLR